VALVIVALVVLVVGTHRSGHPTLDQETTHVASLVRCPVCEGQSAAQSDAPASAQIRTQIHDELAAGEQQGQILAGLVSAYGPGILEKPEAQGIGLVVWVVPVVAVVLALAGLALAFARWRPQSRPAGSVVSDADRALVAHALRPDPSVPADDGPSADG
jgi:cytochrome c-type biogenesis protein CcmH